MGSKLIGGTLRRGAVLVWALITLAVVTTVLGTVGSYHAGSMRVGREYLAANGEYYSFLYAKGQVVDAVDKAIVAANGVAGAEETLETLVEQLRKLNGKNFEDGNNRVEITVQGLDSLAEDLTKGSGTVTILATVYRRGTGGIEVVAKKFEQVLTLRYASGGLMGGDAQSHPIFGYAYFANNRGHLESPGTGKIVVNGDIGSNDRFTINGATVNGYVWAHAQANGQNAVELNRAHIWSYENYLRQVVREYQYQSKEYMTPVRPTNPILTNGKKVAWPGGYEGVGNHEGYVGIGEDGTVSFNYPGDVFEPELDPNLKKGSDPGNRPTAVPMPLPSDSEYYDRVWWNDTSTYLSDLGSWLNQKWFNGKYARISTSTVPKKKALVSVEKYTTSVKDWAKGKGIDMTGQPAQAVLDQWDEDYRVYTNYTTVVAQYQTEHAKWEKSKSTWLSKQQSALSDLGNDLTITTKHIDPITGVESNIVSSTTNVVAMPNVSDAAAYRAYCQAFVCTNASGQSVGSSLICENRYRNTQNVTENIVWQRTVCDRTDWVKSSIGLSDDYPVGAVLHVETNAEDAVTFTRALTSVSIQGGYAKNIYPFEQRSSDGTYKGLDPFYIDTKTTAYMTQAECGSVILIGTVNYPIRIEGPTYFDGDVVIRGFVTGHGTIYAGRNIHIIGDLTYLKPPHWPHSTPGMNTYTPEVTKEANQKKDSLMLVARGNIIIGNYTDSAWMSSCEKWMKIASTDATYRSSVPCCNDYSDDAIGYAGFAHDYTALEGAAEDENAKIVWAYGTDPHTTDYPSDRYNVDYWWFIGSGVFRKPYVCDKKKYRWTPFRSTQKRRFYECKLGGDVINDLMQQSISGKVTSMLQPKWLSIFSGIPILKMLLTNAMGGQLLLTDFDYENATFDFDEVSKADPGDAKAGDITQIDAYLFANHGIFGKVGGSTSHKFKLNGGIICRDEGLLPSFIDHYGNNSGASAWVNWDMRIKSDSAEGLVGTGAPTTLNKRLLVDRSSWRQTK